MIAPPDDIDRIMSVMEQAFSPEYGEAWNRRQVSDALVVGSCRYGLIGADGAEQLSEEADTAGFFMSRGILDEEELLLFAIAPQYRRRGLGHILLSRFIVSAKNNGMSRIFLEMRRGNPAAFLYAAHGFHEIGVRPSYYRTPDGNRIDAISQELSFQD
ncbi:MAG: ribosomal-protein-alanine acetyltransferase [Novosphingobium sp. 17-62-19]|uniref:GNAT family N-acetyltransferase n=1 Tax=Novosphingobium sp. 17-62-19 TaxID=1970406 RepID=UPI000BC4D416|nr:GNAT family N-acetyltransferase [Novosphingobium sp. 17-62-19]OYX92633.1 MAG: ribosomal-protein-alanine acetyltransferase [Novosphingobium sp. 35-62-5]OZA20980.1 MAG: ribosomal-protein-alanine acetyltransferase [Novosphingobium sp. 17-62-19]HQS95475.1 GNAT family N-acetyltransferase [Novosphingobium sp.]